MVATEYRERYNFEKHLKAWGAAHKGPGIRFVAEGDALEDPGQQGFLDDAGSLEQVAARHVQGGQGGREAVPGPAACCAAGHYIHLFCLVPRSFLLVSLSLSDGPEAHTLLLSGGRRPTLFFHFH